MITTRNVVKKAADMLGISPTFVDNHPVLKPMSGDETRIVCLIDSALLRIEWLESMVNAPVHPSTVEWKAALKKFLES